MQPLHDTILVQANVFCVIDEFDLTYCKTKEGHQYALNDRTPGVDRKSLKIGDLLELEVTKTLPRVRKAKLCN